MRIVDNRDEVKRKAIHFIENLGHEVYILGTNRYGLCAARWLEGLGHQVRCFINDFVDDVTFESYRIARSNEVPHHMSIINCIAEARIFLAEENIAKLCPASHIDYFALQLAFPEQLGEINYLDGTDSIADKIEEYQAVYDQLVDPTSQRTFERILSFRLSRNIEFLRGFSHSPDKQYFEPFNQLGSSPSFVDGGSFKGETSMTFVQLYPSYREIYLFEPSESSFSDARINLGSLQRIHFFQKGLWDRSENLSFDDSQGNASRLSTGGGKSIQTVALDSVVRNKVDFIKLDIEGAEYNALIGAKELICRDRPFLAVCVYHNQNDFVRIPQLVLSYDPTYKVYLRHYSQGVLETVMYFV